MPSTAHSTGSGILTKRAKHFDLAVIGAGILGLAHAMHAARAGLKVVVFERSQMASGASVRNFGMLAIVAQAPGVQLNSARRALACWQDVARETGIALSQAGCVFLARAPEEMSVLEECVASSSGADQSFDLLTPKNVRAHSATLQSDTCLGGLWSPDVWKVDQRNAPAKIAEWLHRSYGVEFHFATPVHAVEAGAVDTSVGRFLASHTVLCGGDDFETLFPEGFRTSQVDRCQLQMLRTAPQPQDWCLKPFVLGGLSIARYGVFAACPSLPDLQAYQQMKFGAHLRHGVHVVACQEADGSVTIGDSHAYGISGHSERSEEVDGLILDELSDLISLPDPRIAERWLGHYAHHPHSDTVVLKPDDGVTVVMNTNGQGMTHAFSLAEEIVGGISG